VVVEGLGDGRLEHGGHGRPRREGEGHLEGVAGGRPEHLQDHPPRRRRHFVRAYVYVAGHAGASVVLLVGLEPEHARLRINQRRSTAYKSDDGHHA